MVPVISSSARGTREIDGLIPGGTTISTPDGVDNTQIQIQEDLHGLPAA